MGNSNRKNRGGRAEMIMPAAVSIYVKRQVTTHGVVQPAVMLTIWRIRRGVREEIS